MKWNCVNRPESDASLMESARNLLQQMDRPPRNARQQPAPSPSSITSGQHASHTSPELDATRQLQQQSTERLANAVGLQQLASACGQRQHFGAGSPSAETRACGTVATRQPDFETRLESDEQPHTKALRGSDQQPRVSAGGSLHGNGAENSGAPARKNKRAGEPLQWMQLPETELIGYLEGLIDNIGDENGDGALQAGSSRHALSGVEVVAAGEFAKLLRLSGLGLPADAVTQVCVHRPMCVKCSVDLFLWVYYLCAYVVVHETFEIGGRQLFAKADTNQDGKLQVSTTLPPITQQLLLLCLSHNNCCCCSYHTTAAAVPISQLLLMFLSHNCC